MALGDIPAGMELFAAGDESQWTVIKRWIDESDLFMLILGGRYGSIEPQSGKSYIELEYDHALERGKHPFVVYLSDARLKAIRDANLTDDRLEQTNQVQFEAMRGRLLGTKLCRPFEHPEGVKAAVHESLGRLKEQYKDDLGGWVLAEEAETTISLLTQQHQQLDSTLRATEEKLRSATDPGKRAAKIAKQLLKISITIPGSHYEDGKSRQTTLGQLLAANRNWYLSHLSYNIDSEWGKFLYGSTCKVLALYGILKSDWSIYSLTDFGQEVVRVLLPMAR